MTIIQPRGLMINLFYRSVLFEKVQRTGVGRLTGRFAAAEQASRRKAVAVNNIQEDKQ